LPTTLGSSEPDDSNLIPKEKPTPSSDLDADGVPKPFTILELGSGTGIIIAKLAELINKSANDDSTS
jgi:methylase of polypeptide subunit release factors